MDQKAQELYNKLLEIRKSENLKLKPNPFLKPEVTLRYYQIQMVAHLFIVKRFIIGDDTGTGKTLMTITTYSYLLEKNPNFKIIVIAPSSALYQWANEFDKFTNGISCQIVESESIKNEKGKRLTGYHSREYQFKQFEKNNSNVLIFNYHTLISDCHIILDLMDKYKFMIVFDEATAFKNTETKAFLHASQLSLKADRVYGLSATIIKNKLIEAFSIYKVVVPGLFGSIEKFTRDYCIREKRPFWKGRGLKRYSYVTVGYKNLNHFKQVIDPYFLGRKKATVAKELPEITIKEIRIPMNTAQTQIYHEALKGFLDFNKYNTSAFSNLLEDEESFEEFKDIKKIDKLSALIYCQQICNSPQTIGFNVSSAKEEEFLRLVTTELIGEKIVIYTRFKRMIIRLGELLQKEGINYTWISGEVKSHERETRKKLFTESDDCNIILINSAAKEAINLQISGTLIFYDLPFSYGDFLQIIGRIHRIGNKHQQILLIYLMCSKTIDEKVYKILNVKKKLFDTVLGDSAVGAIKDEDTINNIFAELFEDARSIFH